MTTTMSFLLAFLTFVAGLLTVFFLLQKTGRPSVEKGNEVSKKILQRIFMVFVMPGLVYIPDILKGCQMIPYTISSGSIGILTGTGAG